MAIDSAAKRASALASLNKPYLRLAIPNGTVDRASALGLYSGIAASAHQPNGASSFLSFNNFLRFGP